MGVMLCGLLVGYCIGIFYSKVVFDVLVVVRGVNVSEEMWEY